MSGLIGSKRWELLPSDDAAERRLVEELRIPALVARVLAARGYASVEDARTFLEPSLERDWCDPFLIPGMREAADRLERAITAQETIAVFGDFDVDGMSATCLLTLALRDLGAVAYPFIPNRFGEGYGLSREALERCIDGCNPSLIVTVDNGIAAGNEVAWLLEQGVDVVVTDHHEPGDLVPVGVPVTDPKMWPDCPSRELAGAGVALKLIDVLGHRLGQPELWRRYTEVAMLGTVSDMMLLQGENRALVADGIAHLRHTARPGVLALAACAGVDLTQITADELPFSLVPRLNAAGRMGSTDIAFNLLYTNDPAEAALLAAELEHINNERRETEARLTDDALAEVKRTYHGERGIVVAGDGWHEGVKGIVASRVTNHYHVPAILFSVTDGIARGSGRSVGSVDLFRAVDQCSDLLVRFGGHAGAVGVTCELDKLDAFRERLLAILNELPEEQFEDRGEVAALVSLDEMTIDNIDQLEMLQPFGQGNKKPLFGVRGVCMRNRSRVGATANHLRFFATDGMASVPAIMFRTPDIERAVACDEAVDLVFEAVSETWQGRTKAKLMVRDILYRQNEAPQRDVEDVRPSIADRLFAQADTILARDAYAGIAQATSFVTKVVGVTFEGRQAVVSTLEAGQELLVIREADNPVDANAIALQTLTGEQVGFLRRQIAAVLAPNLDEGVRYQAHVSMVTGGGEGRSYGANIEVTRADAESPAERLAEASTERARLSKLPAAQLSNELRHAMIGNHELLPAQRAALDQLARGRSTLCVMATGRGKSLIFHMHAAREALLHGRASVFVYPLRALVSDQAFHLEHALGALGLTVQVLTGETPLADREEVFEALADGSVDVLLTTPEFLAIHTERFARSGRIGFIVIDEAHHAGTAKGGSRASYTQLPQIRAALGEPVVLAVTATAEDEVAQEVCRLAGIATSDVIVDSSVRANLSLQDCRDVHDREAALVSLVSSGRKCVVYVNSREQSVSLARMLRRMVPELARKISFYNAGLTREERAEVEEAFRSGELCCIISTSAFGEGVNLPDIRDVVLYHLPFGAIEFNQMSGRAGRDGNPACVHLFFGSRDAFINERIIEGGAPARSDLVTLYRTLMTLNRQALASDTNDGSFALTNEDIAAQATYVDARTRLDAHAVSCGISIFRELGFLETSGYGTARRIRMVPNPPRMDLESSTRYLEGLRSRDAFADFKDWALGASAEEMLARINRPITPAFGRLVDG